MLVASFTRREMAEPWMNRLGENGIPAAIHDEPALGLAWFSSRAEGGVRLEVPEQMFERAYDLMTSWDASGEPMPGLIRCPDCGSLRAYYPQHTRRSLIPNLVIGTIATIGRVEKEYYCEDCHFTWPREGTKAPVARPHSAPYYFIDGVKQSPSAQPSKPDSLPT